PVSGDREVARLIAPEHDHQSVAAIATARAYLATRAARACSAAPRAELAVRSGATSASLRRSTVAAAPADAYRGSPSAASSSVVRARGSSDCSRAGATREDEGLTAVVTGL